MSTDHDHDHGHHAKFPQEEDVVPIGKTSGVLIILCVLIVGCCIWAFLLQRHEQKKIGNWGHPDPKERQGQIVGRKTGVDQTLFQEKTSFSQRFLEPQKQQLRSYGWVDREKGTAHIPIDVAMKRVVEEEAAK